MYLLGVTGGIGSGKTTVCKRLEELGARVFYADLEARRLMNEDEALRKNIIAAFGANSYDEKGRLNRSYLAGKVFGNSDQLAQLNKLVHPRVREAFESISKEAVQDSVQVLAYEAALIFETQGEKRLDGVAVVIAPDQSRVDRVVNRDRVTEEEVYARMEHQIDPAEAIARAQFVLENRGSIDALHHQVDALYSHLKNINK